MEHWENLESLWQQLENLRKRLERYADRMGSRQRDVDADDTIFLVYQRLSTGFRLNNSLEAYCYGVLKNLVRQRWKKAKKETEFDSVAEERMALNDENKILTRLLLVRLDKCTEALDERARRLVLLMLKRRGPEKTKEREALAQERGVTPNALEQEWHRIREDLKACVDGKGKETPRKY